MENKLEMLEYEYNKEIMIRVMGDTTLVYNPENGDMYELNDVGSEILHLFKDNVGINHIFAKMCEEYDVTKDDIYEDINEIVMRMLELGIIRSTK